MHVSKFRMFLHDILKSTHTSTFSNELLFVLNRSPQMINHTENKMRVLQIKRLKQAFHFYYVPYSQLLFSYIEKPLVVIMAKGLDLHTLYFIKVVLLY